MHLFKVRLKCLLRDRTILFWTLFFPIILATFFNFTLAKANYDLEISTIKIGVVESSNYPTGFLELLENVEFDHGQKMFSVNSSNLEILIDALDHNQITGYIEITSDNVFHLTVKEGGINATILKSFIDEYLQTESMINTLIINALDPQDIDKVIADLSKNANYLTADNKGTNTPTYMLTYFYSLLGMALIYGGYWGVNEIINVQANLSPRGMRISVSPTKRLKLLLINMGCAFLIHISEILVFLAYVTLVLGINFGSDFFLIILLCILGSITGISFGAFIGISLKRASEGVKVGITTVVGILGGALSGMMYPNIKYWVSTKLPILSYINPVSIITDGLYSLYYYPTKDRYVTNIIILAIMAVVFITGTYLNFRSDSYESV